MSSSSGGGKMWKTLLISCSSMRADIRLCGVSSSSVASDLLQSSTFSCFPPFVTAAAQVTSTHCFYFWTPACRCLNVCALRLKLIHSFSFCSPAVLMKNCILKVKCEQRTRTKTCFKLSFGHFSLGLKLRDKTWHISAASQEKSQFFLLWKAWQ